MTGFPNIVDHKTRSTEPAKDVFETMKILMSARLPMFTASHRRECPFAIVGFANDVTALTVRNG